jgi:hypothetical protein
MSSYLHDLTLTSIASAVFAANVQIHVVVMARIAHLCTAIAIGATGTNKLALVVKPDVAVATHAKFGIRTALFVLRVLGFKIFVLMVLGSTPFTNGLSFLGIHGSSGSSGTSRHFVRSRRRKSH